MEEGPARKRLRRSTRSCYQCRKRKVKCQLTNEDVETCAECLKSGTRCTLQPPTAEQSSGTPPVHIDEQHESRLARIESLLKGLVEAQERSQSSEASSGSDPAAPALDNIWSDFLLHSPDDGSLPLIDGHDIAIPQLSGIPDARQSLLALLPSAEDAFTIVKNTTIWLWGPENPPGSVLTPADSSRLLEITAIPRGSTIHIAKILLLFALCMQQLPASFDARSLGSPNVERTIELIVERVNSFVLSNEDDSSSLDGLECLILLCSIQLNDGALRKMWMTVRRILDISRLKGIHKSFSLSKRNSSCGEVALHRRLWLSTVCGDCYCSLLLGLEPGLGLAPFGPDDDTWIDPLADEEANVQRHVCLIVARIAQRNAVGLHQDRHILQEIDEALNKLQDSLPLSWWKTPSFRRDQPLDSAKEPNRLICQLWFFQARMFAHLPIASGNTNESLHSLESCMEASRISLHRCLNLQHVRDQLSRCRSIDQSALLSAVVLLLSKVQLRYHKISSISSRYDFDRVLLEQVIDSFEAAGEACRREHVVRQSAYILSTMLHIVDADLEHHFLTASTPPNNDTLLALGIPINPEIVNVDAVGMAKYGMEDIIASSIQPVLDIQSPASRLVELLFASTRSASGVPEYFEEPSQGRIGLTLDDVIDPAFLQ
ncbi:hypothetical protein GGR54DRAFT_301723 [Hypoxylon sp. NC1633]|nr:hypothetical protein GGR54DRAFT_301723 [Hypoxylon sp. NC1633]